MVKEPVFVPTLQAPPAMQQMAPSPMDAPVSPNFPPMHPDTINLQQQQQLSKQQQSRHQQEQQKQLQQEKPPQQQPAEASSRRCPFQRGQRVKLPKGMVNYQLEGPPAPAPLVILIHGLNGAISSFANLTPLLVSAGLRVLSFDLFGFGLSATPMGRLDLETYVDQVYCLLQALSVKEQVLLLGFSMGGVVAVEFANRFPGMVAKLVLVAPGGLMKREETPCKPLLFGCLRERWGDCFVSAATCLACCCSCCIRRYLGKGKQLAEKFEPDVREPGNFKDVAQKTGERFLWDVKRSVNSYLRVLRRMPLWEDDFKGAYITLSRSSMPVLFIWGESDCTVPFSESKTQLCELFGHRETSVLLIPEGGHGLMLEDAQLVATYAAAWFQDIRDPAWRQLLQQSRFVPTPGVTPSPIGAAM